MTNPKDALDWYEREPTKNFADPTTSATDELRRLLDERGVEWEEREDFDATWTDHDGRMYCAREEFTLRGPTDELTVYHLTPEQAIEATLGRKATEEPPYGELIEALARDWGIEASWDGLRRFWYIGLNEKGMRDRDERDAALGRGECRIETVTTDARDWPDNERCTGCGEFVSVLNPMHPRFCPRCGRKVVDE